MALASLGLQKAPQVTNLAARKIQVHIALSNLSRGSYGVVASFRFSLIRRSNAIRKSA